MLSLGDLKNRVYSGKQCMRFECMFMAEDKPIIAAFERKKSVESNEWNMRVIIDRTRDKDSDVYNFGYIMPRSDLPLELIAATGLKYFQLYLREEVQTKSLMEFSIGEMLEGM